MIPLAYKNVVANNHDRKQGDQAFKSKPPRFEANKNHSTGGHTLISLYGTSQIQKLKKLGSKNYKSKIEHGHLNDHIHTGYLKKVTN